jgi:tricorn protease
MATVPSPDAETLLLSFPSASASKLAFVHGATDIWLCDLVSGVPSAPRRIVAGNGTLANLRISPDEQWVAFSGNECGQWAVYIQRLSGGLPQRLTYHPGNGMVAHNRGAEPRDSIVTGWTADSSHVLFTSTRLSPLARGMGQLYQVPIDPSASPTGALPTALPLPEVFSGVLSPDGDAIAYVELPPPTATWKRYRGGQTQPVMMFDLTSLETTSVPFENDNCSCPCWASDGNVYFISDRSGSSNIWSYSPATSKLTQMTAHTEQDTKYLSFTLGASVLAYSQAGEKTALFAPFIYKMHYFTKTGSGRT